MSVWRDGVSVFDVPAAVNADNGTIVLQHCPATFLLAMAGKKLLLHYLNRQSEVLHGWEAESLQRLRLFAADHLLVCSDVHSWHPNGSVLDMHRRSEYSSCFYISMGENQ